jgi:hypothetical protein
MDIEEYAVGDEFIDAIDHRAASVEKDAFLDDVR